MTLHVVYRSSDSPGKDRPDFFDKTVALQSFLRALEQDTGPRKLTFLNDGPLSDGREELMHGHGDVVALDRLGNCGSYRQALALVERTAADDDLTYLVEDDYLHLPGALTALRSAASEIPAAGYFTLCDYPDRYGRTDDADLGRTRVFIAGDRHWRSVESTPMTFAARVGQLRRDSWIHHLGSQQAHPQDGGIWHAILGLGSFRLTRAVGSVGLIPWDRLALRHVAKGLLLGAHHDRPLLVSPMPTLACHCERIALSPLVDWAAVAAETRAWADGN